MGGGGGGGGSTQIALRQPSTEKKTIGNWYDFQKGQLGDYIGGSPLLSAANTGALNFYNQVPGLISPLAAQQGQAPGFYGGLQSQLGGLQGQIGGYQNQLQGLSGQLGGLIPGIQNQLGGLYGKLGSEASTLGGYLGGPSGISATIANQGALTPQMGRDVAQQTRAIQAAQGTATTNQDLGSELLNRQAYQQQRFNTALQQGQGILGQQAGLYGQQAGLTQLGTGLTSGLIGQQAGIAGQGAGLTGLSGNIYGQQGGLFGQQGALNTALSQGQQGLQSGALNQLTGTQGANVSTFSGLTNPILQYLGTLFSNNLQGSIAQAQINQAGNIQSANSKGGATAGGIGAIGSIIGQVAPLLIASDERIKTKIKETGMTTPEGINLKTFEFKTRPGIRFLGPMAQDVEKRLPNRVITDPQSGVKMIVGFPVVQISPVRKKVV